MDKERKDYINAFLCYDDQQLVDHVVGRAMLTDAEREVVELRGVHGLSIYGTARALDVSDGYVKKHSRDGYGKLDKTMSLLPWLTNGVNIKQ